MDFRAVALRARRAFADLLVALFVVLTRGTVRAAVLRARMALRASSSTCSRERVPVADAVFSGDDRLWVVHREDRPATVPLLI